MEASNLFNRIQENRETIQQSYSSKVEGGLLTLLSLTELPDMDLSSINLAAELVKDLSEEKVYYDLKLLGEVTDIGLESVYQNDVEDLIAVFMDRSVESILGSVGVNRLADISAYSKANSEDMDQFFVSVLKYRISIYLRQSVSIERVFITRRIDELGKSILNFSLNFIKLFELKKRVKELLAIDSQITEVCPHDGIKKDHELTIHTIKELARSILENSTSTTVNREMLVVRYLISLINLFPNKSSDISEGVKSDLKVLNRGRKKNTLGMALVAVVFMFFASNTFFINVQNWYFSTTAEKNFNLVVKSSINPVLIDQLPLKSTIVRLNEIISPTIEEFRKEITDSTGDVVIEFLIDGKNGTVTVPLMERDGKPYLGISLYNVSGESKLWTVLMPAIFLSIFLSAISSYAPSVGIFEPLLTYVFNLFVAGYLSFTTIPRILSGSVDVWVIGISLIGIWLLYASFKTRWILTGWIKKPLN